MIRMDGDHFYAEQWSLRSVNEVPADGGDESFLWMLFRCLNPKAKVEMG